MITQEEFEDQKKKLLS
ncbi:hypothetical protein [Heyndrickxia coagulans]